jgi:hypothetical protein
MTCEYCAKGFKPRMDSKALRMVDVYVGAGRMMSITLDAPLTVAAYVVTGIAVG